MGTTHNFDNPTLSTDMADADTFPIIRDATGRGATARADDIADYIQSLSTLTFFNGTAVSQASYSGAFSAFAEVVTLSGGSNYGFSSSAQVLSVIAFMQYVKNVLTRYNLAPSA